MLSNVAVCEAAQAESDPGDAYCRVRRDLKADWVPIISEVDGSSVVLITPPALVSRIALRPDLPPRPTLEHRSTLTRRIRAPGGRLDLVARLR